MIRRSQRRSACAPLAGLQLTTNQPKMSIIKPAATSSDGRTTVVIALMQSPQRPSIGGDYWS